MLGRICRDTVNAVYTAGFTNTPVRMTVDTRRSAVSCPSCVRDACMRIENLGEIRLLVLDQLLQFGNLSDFLEGENLVLFIAINS